jgi:hypothetical protein
MSRCNFRHDLQLRAYSCRVLLWVTQENSIDLEVRRQWTAAKMRYIPVQKTLCWSAVGFCVCELTHFSVIFCFLPRSVIFSWVIDSTYEHNAFSTFAHARSCLCLYSNCHGIATDDKTSWQTDMGRSDCPDIPSPKILNLLRRRVVLSCLHRRNCQMNWMVTCVGVVMNLKSFSKVVYRAKKLTWHKTLNIRNI